RTAARRRGTAARPAARAPGACSLRPMATHDPHADPGLVEEREDRAADGGGPAPGRPGRTAERVVLGLYVLVLVWVVLLKIHTGDLGDLVGRRSVNLVPTGGTAAGGLGSRELAVNVL